MKTYGKTSDEERIHLIINRVYVYNKVTLFYSCVNNIDWTM